MKILIDDKENIYVDGKQITNETINSTFLEELVEKGLNNDVEFELNADETLPIVKLFSDIKEMVQPDSEFYKKIAEIRESKNKLEESSDFDLDKELLRIDDFFEI